MRTIERDIVGAFIFSADGKVLLGHNKKGGVYTDQLIVPGGGIEENESKQAALQRETYEETGIDTTQAVVTEIAGDSSGESTKTLRDTGEQVLVKMHFYDFMVQLPQLANDIALKFEDDYAEATWYTAHELTDAVIGPATKATLQKLNFI